MSIANPNLEVDTFSDEEHASLTEREIERHERFMSGWRRYEAGRPVYSCLSADERRGWRAAFHAAGTDGMTKAQLEALGI